VLRLHRRVARRLHELPGELVRRADELLGHPERRVDDLPAGCIVADIGEDVVDRVDEPPCRLEDGLLGVAHRIEYPVGVFEPVGFLCAGHGITPPLSRSPGGRDADRHISE
jgi:hypothetical protein